MPALLRITRLQTITETSVKFLEIVISVNTQLDLKSEHLKY